MRIFDTFPYDGEQSLLRHRVAELYDLVDAFVIVEARRTYRDEPKTLRFSADRESVAWAEPKIRYLSLDRLGPPEVSPRRRAALQRNLLLLALQDAAPEDIVLLCDADEVPSRELLICLRQKGLSGPHRLAMTRHYEFLNLVAPRSPCCPALQDPFPFAVDALRPPAWAALDATWHGRSAVAVRYDNLKGEGSAVRSPFAWRFEVPLLPELGQAGRHFSSVDPVARLESKLGRVFHAEHADVRGTSVAHLRRCRHYGIHHRGWWYAQIPPGELPGDLQRLASRSSALQRMSSLPPMPLRRAARSWAWIRLSPRLPQRCIHFVDRHYEVLLPLLLMPLLLADVLRGLYSHWRLSRRAVPRRDATCTL